MTGGTLILGGTLNEFHNPTITINSAATTAQITSVTGLAQLRLRDGTSATINVADGPPAVDFLIAATVTQNTGTSGITKNGLGTMTLSGSGASASNAVGPLVVNGGTVIAGAGFAGDGGWAGNVTINSSATLQFAQNNIFNNGSDFTINAGGTLNMAGFGDAIGNLQGGGAIINHTNTITLDDLSGTRTFTGTIAGGGGLTLRGGVDATGTQVLSGATYALGNVVVGRGTLTFNGAPVVTMTGTFAVGDTNGAGVGSGAITAVANINGGTFTINHVEVGNRQSGSATVNATINQTAGTVAVTGGPVDGANLRIGHWPSTTANYNLSGTGILTPSTALGTAVDGNGTFTQTGGTLNTPLIIVNLRNNAGNGVFNLNGGITNIGAGGITTTGTPGTTSILNLGGGTIRATATFSTTHPAVLTNAVGSAIFDTNGNNITWSGALSGPGGLNKNISAGNLTLTGTNTYLGITNVNAGVLQLQNGLAINDAGVVNVANLATLQLLTSETISSYVGADDGANENDSVLALGGNTLTTTGSATIANVTSANGSLVAGASIVDNDTDVNVTGTGVFLQAGASVGTLANPIETAVANLEGAAGTGYFVASTTGVNIGGVTAATGVSATGGDIVITAAGAMTVSENVTATGAGTDVVLTTTDVAAVGQNLTVNLGATVSSALASVTLNAGDDATITGNVTSGTTTTMNVDFGDAETNGVGEVAPGSGGALVITGVVTTPVVGSGGGAFLNGNDDFDTFTLNPQTTTEFRINGNPPANTVAGDILVMNVTGTTNPNLTVPGTTAPYTGPGSGSWSFTSAHRPVLFTSIEDSTITGQYHLTYDNSVTPVANLFVMRDAATTRVQLRDGSTGGPVVYQGLLSVILSLRILGSGGNDIVTIDDINTLPDFAGTVPGVTNNPNLAGAAEFLFDGLGGSDTLVYNIAGANASQSYAIGNGTGAAGLEGEIESTAAGLLLLSYFQNVELTQRTGVGAAPAALTFLGDSSGNSFSTAANGAATRTSITGYTPFEFSGNNYTSLNIFALAGADLLDLVSLGTGQTNNPAFFQFGGSEDDTLRVRSTSGNTGPITLNGNAGSDLIQLFDALNTVDGIVGPVVADGFDGNLGGNTDTLTIVDSGDPTFDNVLISAINPGASQDYAVEGITSTAGNDVVFRNIDVLNYTGTQGNDTIDGQFVNTVPQHDLNTVSLSGWLGADQFLLFTSDQIGGTAPTPSGTASGVANISLFGDAPGNPNAGDGNDIFGATPVGVVGTGVTNVGLVVPDTTRMIRPSVTTSIAIDGGQPTGLAAPLGDVIGDVNNVDISALPNSTPVIVSTFSPGTVAAAGISPLTWTQIEDINVVDQGKLTNVQMGDLFARTTPAADLVQITRNPTLLNPNQVRLRITATIGNYSASNKTIIYGGGANDTITQSNLTIPAEFYGEAGDDYLSGAMNNDWLVGGLGNDRINGSGGDNVIWGDNSPTNPGDLTPQDGAVGGNDQLSGLGGNDVFYAGAGDDSVSAGAGNDYVSGGQGNDTLDGNDGDDRLYGAAGNDILSGHAGNDLLSGSGGDDKLFSAAGNDVLFGGTGLDQIDGGDGNDLLVSGSVANENSTWTSVANTTTYSAATYTSGSDNDAALLTLLTQWGSSSNRSSIGAISHDGVNDDLLGYTGDDDFCWETVDVLDNPPGLTPSDFNAFGMGTDERFGPT